MTEISAKQSAVLCALLSGATLTAAADLAGVHRNTIANWRASDMFFRYALNDALYDRAQLHRERAEELLSLAYQQLELLLQDPKTPASIRMKAVQYIIEKATTAPQPKPQVPLDIEKIRYTEAEPVDAPEPVHNSAQQPTPEPVQTLRREHPKVGRNAPCPCGSNRKFKHCCLNKPLAQAA